MMNKITKRLWEKKNSKKGFTLVELIVVLVILAILAAIMVPALLGWIDKAKEKEILLEGRSVYLAAQTLASEAYGAPASADDGPVLDYGRVTTLAGVSGTVTASTITFGTSNKRDRYTVTGITYVNSGYTAVYTTAGGWVITTNTN